jgi:hypothetical protein
LFPRYVFGPARQRPNVAGKQGAAAIDTLQYLASALLAVQTVLVIALLVQNRRHLRARADV